MAVDLTKRMFSDAKADELIAAIEGLAGSGNSGMSDAAKAALLNCFAHVAWIDDQGQRYYNDLYSKLFSDAVDWDYEWHAASLTLPTGFVSQPGYYSFTDNPGFLKISGGSIDFNNTGDNFEVAIDMRGADTGIAVGASGSPFPVIAIVASAVGNEYKAIKFFAIVDDANNNIRMQDGSGTTTTLNYSYNDEHLFNLRVENGNATLAIDGNVVGNGLGEYTTSGVEYSGIWFPRAVGAYSYVKSIKYRRIA